MRIRVDVVIVQDTQTSHISAPASRHNVVSRLICVGNHVSLGALLAQDGTTDFYPPTACTQLTLLDGALDYTNHERPAKWNDWKQLYVGEDHDRLTPEEWSGWDEIRERLDEYFGNGYETFQAERRSPGRKTCRLGVISPHPGESYIQGPG